MGNTFKHKKEFDIKPLPKKSKHLKFKVTMSLICIAVVFSFFGLFAFLVNEYITTHSFTWQSPVIVRTPVVIKSELQIISPLSTRSGYLNIQAEAAEVKNPFDERSPKGKGWEMNKERFGVQHWGALEELIQRESGWNPYAMNPTSSAGGIGQALPYTKMGCELWDYDCQIEWLGGYIAQRYGNPTKALNFWDTQKAETGAGWY